VALIDRRAKAVIKGYIHCVQTKRDQRVSCNISYKTQAMLTKFCTPFPE